MREIINYILEANLALLAFLAAYVMLLKKENSFGILRAYLLCAIVFSLVFPLIHFQNNESPSPLSIGNVLPEYWLPEVTISASRTGSAEMHSAATETWSVVGWIYISGVAIGSLWLICQVGYVIILTLNSKSYRFYQYRIIESPEDKPTFSFFNLIYIGKSTTLDDQEKEQIIKHESIHAKQLHSFDMLLVTLVKNFFWFNPFIKYYKELFIQLHEFEADARAVENSDVNKYCNLLARVALQSHFPIASHFNESLTVKRIEMMRTLKKKIEKWKIAAMLVIIFGCFVIVSCNDQLVDDLDKSTLSQSGDIPAEVQKHMQDWQKSHPDSKLTYLEGSREDVQKFVKTPEVRGRVVYEYAYRGDEKEGVLLSDVVQHAEALKSDEQVFMVVEQMPEYQGGFDALRDFLRDNIKYPKQAAEKGEVGTVYVSMVIDETGVVKDAKVIRGVSSSIDAEAVRVVSMMPKWKPGTQNGKAVKVRYNIPIKFDTGEGEKKSSVGALVPVNQKLKLARFEKVNAGTGKRLAGKVLDENGNPLSGLTVLIEGTTTGTKTDSNGDFKLQTSTASGKLVLSYIGFDSQTVSY